MDLFFNAYTSTHFATIAKWFILIIKHNEIDKKIRPWQSPSQNRDSQNLSLPSYREFYAISENIDLMLFEIPNKSYG